MFLPSNTIQDFPMYKFPDASASTEQDYNSPGLNGTRRLEDIVPYGITLVQAPELWPSKRKPKPVKVCIVDTGYDITHDDLPKKGVTSTATNFADAFVDRDGHGTHIAGIIGALGNAEGVVGGLFYYSLHHLSQSLTSHANLFTSITHTVNPTSKSFSFHISKALGDDGRGSASTVIEGVEGCLEAGAKIITLSLGGGMRSIIQEALFKKTYDEGVLVFAASGNSGTNKAEYPASYPYVISVAAVNEDEEYAGFSNYNDQVEFVGEYDCLFLVFADEESSCS
jgi:subtilisin family serine protease